jgi:hypothetical protein
MGLGEMAKNRKGSSVATSRFVGPGSNPMLSACLNYGLDSWMLYADGYWRAAELLVEHVETTHEDQDFLIFPVLFLYRHYVELRLKQLMKSASDLLGRPYTVTHSHDLVVLWSEAARSLAEVGQEFGDRPDPKQFADTKRRLRELELIDPESMAFRYPEDRKHNAHLAGVHYINFGVVQTEMKKIAEVLDGAELSLSVMRDWRDEAFSAIL